MSGAHAAEERWRHAWAAFVLGAIAVIALGLITFVLTTSPVHTHVARPPVLLTEVPAHSPTAAPSRNSTGPSATASHSRAPSTNATPSTSAVALTTMPPRTSARVVVHPSRPASRPGSGRCAAGAPCVVGGTGQVESALDQYRRAHGSQGVAAVVTDAAQRCAVTGGDGPSCADPFAVARERQQSGHQAVDDIASGYGNWLLDPNLRSVEVGWAYDPRTAQYVCVLIART